MTQPAEMASLPSFTPAARKSARVELSADVVLRRSGRVNYRVSVFDMSPHGCKAEFVDRPGLQEIVWLKFANLDSMEALVRWTRGCEVGLEFVRPIYPAVFDMLVTKLNGYRPASQPLELIH